MAATAPTTLIPTGTWSVDRAHSKVGFAVKHMGIATVRGEFKDFEGTLEIGPDLSKSRMHGKVRTASIDTNDADRDAHLLSPDFFDAEANPEITFESTRIEPAGDNTLRVTGNLTMHGVTKEITLDAHVVGVDVDPWGNQRVGLEVSGELSREDFGMTFNQALGSGNLLVGDKVRLALDISAVRQAD
jgi:polyisoprenoid-binding protein YceI